MQSPFLIGEKIYLRPIEMEDVDFFVQTLNDPEVNQYLAFTFPINRIREREFVENLYKDRDHLLLAIVLKENDQMIGNCAFHKVDWLDRNAEFGIYIGDKSCWSKGYGTEATKLMVDHGFSQLNLNRIFLRVYDFNKRGIRAYEKAGFTLEGILREEKYRNGAYHDVHIMGILRSDWEKRRERD